MGWITPNWDELSVLSGVRVRKIERREPGLPTRWASFIRDFHIVATGGDQEEPIDLLRAPGGAVQTFRGERVETTSTHGTGCAFSAALLSRLILGDAPAKWL